MPVAVKVTSCEVDDPTATFPKLTCVELGDSCEDCDAGGAPVPGGVELVFAFGLRVTPAHPAANMHAEAAIPSHKVRPGRRKLPLRFLKVKLRASFRPLSFVMLVERYCGVWKRPWLLY